MRKLHFLPKGVEHNLPIPAAQKNQKTKADGEKQHQERPSRALMDTHAPSLEEWGRSLTALETKDGKAENAPRCGTGAAGDLGGQRP